VITPSADDVTADLVALRERGFSGIMITHRDERVDPRTDALLSAACGAPLRATHATVWKVPGE
jgi:hypothetical protein